MDMVVSLQEKNERYFENRFNINFIHKSNMKFFKIFIFWYNRLRIENADHRELATLIYIFYEKLFISKKKRY